MLAGTAAGAPDAALPQGAPAGSSATLENADTATSSTPTNDNVLSTIHINGNNPATAQVGVSYADLGATITGPQADLNLGIITQLDGATTTSIQLDTTKPGAHTILFTASATRTIIVSAAVNDNAAASSTPSVATSSPPIAPAANDNTPIVPLAATGTDATSTP